MTRPFIVGIGGTPKPNSTTEQALQLTLAATEAAGARTQLFGGSYLASLPIYLAEGTSAGAELVDAVRAADGLILASPGYHGSISGALKNAIDYLEETARDDRVYLDGLPVGLVVTAFGWQATGGTLAALRSIVHSLRGWPTPLGAAVNTSVVSLRNGLCSEAASAAQLELVGRQVADFARLRLTSLSQVGAGNAAPGLLDLSHCQSGDRSDAHH